MNIKTNLQRVLELFFVNPTTSLHIRKIARLTDLSPAAASKFLRELDSVGLIIKCKKEVTTEYKANRDKEEFKWRKRIYNIESLYETGLLRYLMNKYGTFATLILFGSYSTGEDWEGSDIDISVISPNKTDVNLAKFERLLGRKISIHEPDLKHVSKEFLSNLINGFVLEGYLDYEKI